MLPVSGEPEIIGMIQISELQRSSSRSTEYQCQMQEFSNAGDCFYYGNTVLGWFQTREGYWIDRNYAKVMTDAEVENYLKANGRRHDHVCRRFYGFNRRLYSECVVCPKIL